MKVQQSSDVAIFLCNYHTGIIKYANPAFSNLLGYDVNDFIKNGLDFLYSKMHPADYPIILESFIANLEVLTSQAEDRLSILTQQFRCKHAQGHYLQLTMNNIVLEFTNEGTPSTGMGKISLSNNNTSSRKYHPNFFQKKPPYGISKISKMFDPISEITIENQSNLLLDLAFAPGRPTNVSKREKEILQLLADGYSAKEIASMLFISATTVITHRKNLIEKFNVRNTAELIKKATKFYWLA